MREKQGVEQLSLHRGTGRKLDLLVLTSRAKPYIIQSHSKPKSNVESSNLSRLGLVVVGQTVQAKAAAQVVANGDALTKVGINTTCRSNLWKIPTWPQHWVGRWLVRPCRHKPQVRLRPTAQVAAAHF